jgi:hypothetical protein
MENKNFYQVELRHRLQRLSFNHREEIVAESGQRRPDKSYETINSWLMMVGYARLGLFSLR